jgi:hypothetical protein
MKRKTFFKALAALTVAPVAAIKIFENNKWKIRSGYKQIYYEPDWGKETIHWDNCYTKVEVGKGSSDIKKLLEKQVENAYRNLLRDLAKSIFGS